MYRFYGKRAKRFGEHLTKSFNTLVFTVEGDRFPAYSEEMPATTAAFQLYSNTPNSIDVNFADGSVDTYDFVPYLDGYRISFSFDGLNHIYEDENTGLRTISVEIKAPQEITNIIHNRQKITGASDRDWETKS